MRACQNRPVALVSKCCPSISRVLLIGAMVNNETTAKLTRVSVFCKFLVCSFWIEGLRIFYVVRESH